MKSVASIITEIGKNAYDYLDMFADFGNEQTSVRQTVSVFEIETLKDSSCDTFVNLHRINDIKRINLFFEKVNSKLPKDGIFIGRIEIQELRKKRLLKKYFFPFNYVYYFFDFILKRIFPKLPFLKKIYFLITANRNRVISRAEGLGRLYYCGFQVVSEKIIDNHLYFVVKKVKEVQNRKEKSYYLLYLAKRYAKNNKPTIFYKFRTMHPYSEYLQEYVYQLNNLKEGGKLKDDFRLTSWGKWMRKYWVDELPMLYNLLKGDLKLFGVRPLSEHYLSLYTQEVKELRIKTKPGLIPPFYADMPNTLEEIIDSEKKYIINYLEYPLTTDIKYFRRAILNIVLKKARSN